MRVSKRFLSTTRAVKSPKIFDRELKWKQKDWLQTLSSLEHYQYIHNEIGDRLMGRLEDLKSRRFNQIVELGSNFNVEKLQKLRTFTDKPIIQLSSSSNLFY